jgi:hypothetical protein
MEWFFVPLSVCAVLGGWAGGTRARSSLWFSDWPTVAVFAVNGALCGLLVGAALGGLLWLARSAHLLATQPA